MTAVSWEWVEERLASAHNFWLATVTPDGRPYVRPVWCLWRDGGLLFTASARSRKMRNAAENPNVSVVLELDREVVVVDGRVAETAPDADAVDAYGAKYGWRPPPEQRWYRVEPSRVYAADEATYPASAATFTL
jgi:PPOX class probable F420-dependent enzyme